MELKILNFKLKNANFDALAKIRKTGGFNCRGAMLRARYRARAACPYHARRAKTEERGALKGAPQRFTPLDTF